ncbi:peptidylprolyl isomerase [Coriobacteriales bacterium OH1046]|nr:peptidylprolyl isomerase [Coriobacteriales bacterium OH1046]
MSHEGKNVSVHYVGTLDDGSEFDSSRRRGEPLRFTCMAGQMIPGFDAAVRDMNVGETVNVRLEPEEAYGPRNEAAVVAIPRRNFPHAGEPEVGSSVMLMSPQGKPVPAVVAGFDDQTIRFDINHPMAGKTLNFEIELLSAE